MRTSFYQLCSKLCAIANIKQKVPYMAIPKAPCTAPLLHLETERNTEGPEGPSFFETIRMIQQEQKVPGEAGFGPKLFFQHIS